MVLLIIHFQSGIFKPGAMNIKYRTVSMLSCLRKRHKRQGYAYARYLLRESIKVVGATEQGLEKTTIGLFYVDLLNPY